MRGAISIIMAISLVSSPAIATDGEPDRIAALEARLAALHAEVSALKSKSAPKPQPPAMAAARSVAPAAVRLAGIAALGGIPPILAYPGYGGGGPTGGGAVTSANMPDPYVPVDGTMNVTGAINASSGITAGGYVTTANGVYKGNGNAYFGYGLHQSNDASVRSGVADGASAVGVYIEANADLTTSGAKIASFGDNAGVSYAEKLFIDKDGSIGIPNTSANAIYVTGNPSVGITMATTIYKLAPASTDGVIIGTSGSKDTCDSSIRGAIFYQAGGAGVADVFYVCTKSAADAYAWRDIAAPTP